MVLSQPCQVKYLSNVSPCCVLVIQSCPTLCYPCTAAYQAPLSMGFPSKNTAVGYHSLFQQVFWTQRSNLGLLHRRQILYCLSYQVLAVKWVKVAQSCLTLCDPMDYIVHGILQARILEWAAFLFSRGSSQSRDWTQVSHIADFFLPAEPPGKYKNIGVGTLCLLQPIFLTQELNWGLLHCRWVLYQLSYEGRPLPVSTYLMIFFDNNGF